MPAPDFIPNSLFKVGDIVEVKLRSGETALARAQAIGENGLYVALDLWSPVSKWIHFSRIRESDIKILGY